jgi:hypothetical protein
VSHQPERKEKNCLNCGATVAGRFCQVCGQENTITKMGVWAFTSHFLYDLLHFDGKFFGTLRYLLLRPGFVPSEYISGKRQRYLEPIKMYLFTSAFFFLVFFYIANPDDLSQVSGGRLMTRAERFSFASQINSQLKKNSDSLLHRKLDILLDTTYSVVLLDTSNRRTSDSTFAVIFEGMPYIMETRKAIGEEIKIHSTSPWVEKKLDKKLGTFRTKYGDDINAMLRDIASSFLHKLPYILFVSLPFFALILKLLYIRKKQLYYSEHAIFTLYHYIFTFIALLFFFVLTRLNDSNKSGFLDVLSILFFILPGVYLFFAMKRFYVQGFGKTLLKFILLNVFAVILLILLLLVFILLSIFQI